MHIIIIDGSGLSHESWSALCVTLDNEAYIYSSTSQDKKIYVEAASLSQMADVVELIRNESPLN